MTAPKKQGRKATKRTGKPAEAPKAPTANERMVALQAELKHRFLEAASREV